MHDVASSACRELHCPRAGNPARFCICHVHPSHLMAQTALRAALLVLAVCSCQARIIAFGVQDGASIASRPSYSDFSGSQPRPVDITQSVQDADSNSYLFEPNQMQLAWAYQQADLLNTLQSFMLTPRKPCGHSSRALGGVQPAPLSTHTMNPMVMSYLASSRLPSLPAFDVFAQADDEVSTDSTAQISFLDSSSLPTAADDLVSSSIISALSSSADAQTQAESDFETQPTQTELEVAEDDDFAVTQFRQAVEDLISDRRQARTVDGGFTEEEAVPMEGSMASAEWTASDQLAQQREDLDDSLDWSIVNDDGSINWAVLLFGLLCIACGAVWFSLLRTWCALGRSCLSCPRKQRQEQFLTLSADDMTSPLLAPLQHEGLGTPTGTMKASDFIGAKKIEVASEHANHGVEYVTIAYAPLKGEA